MIIIKIINEQSLLLPDANPSYGSKESWKRVSSKLNRLLALQKKS